MQRLKGFTLIELLVVISIIALLIGILLPALGAARKSAINIKCLSNHRQIATGLAGYNNDNNDRYPNKRLIKFSPTGIYLGGWVASYTWIGTLGQSGGSAARFGADVRYLNSYIGGPYTDEDARVDMGICPADEQQGDDAVFFDWGTSYRANTTHGRSLTYNSTAVVKDNIYQNGRLVSSVVSPSRTVAVLESQSLEVVQPSYNENNPIEDRMFWHTNPGDYRFNTSFCDGHAASITFVPNDWANDEYTFNVDETDEYSTVEK